MRASIGFLQVVVVVVVALSLLPPPARGIILPYKEPSLCEAAEFFQHSR